MAPEYIQRRHSHGGPIALTSNLVSGGTVLSGATVSITAAITSIGNGPAPTGTLQFYDGSTRIGAPVPLQQGAGTYSSAVFAVGSHSVTAVYSGDSNYSSITSTPVTFSIVAQGTDTLSLAYTGPTLVAIGNPLTIPGNIVYSPVLGPAPSGVVSLLEDGTAIGSATLGTSPAFSITVNTNAMPLTAGTHVFTLHYPGDTHWSSGTSSSLSLQFAQATSALTVSYTGPASVAAGSPVTIAGQITGMINGAFGPSAPTGTVTLLDGATAIATATLSGTALPVNFSFVVNKPTAPLATGAHVLSLSYPGNVSWTAGTSGTVALSITGDVPNFTLTSSAGSYSNVVQGTPVTFTATAGATNGLPTPTGTVQFYLDGTALGSPATVTGGVATYMTSTLSAGSHTVTAAYSGNSSYDSTTTNGTVAIVAQGSDALAVTPPSASTVAAGTPITLTGTLNVTSLGPAPTGAVNGLPASTGTVQFSIDGQSAGTPVALSAGAAAFTPGSLSAGSHTVAAAYSGDSTYTTATSSETITIVTQGSDTLAVTPPSASTVAAGTPITLTGTLNVTSLGPPPTGTVTLLDNGAARATATLSGNPPFALSFQINTAAQPLTGGAHTFTLQYPGTAQWTPAATGSVAVTIAGNSPKFALASSIGNYSSVVQGTAVSFSATAGAVNGLPAPTGTVQFSIDGQSAGTPVALSAGAAAFTPGSLSAGSHTIAAAYSGDSTYTTATSSETITVVTQGSDALVLTAPPPPTVDAGTPVTLTATLNVTSLGPAPTGAVTLLDNGTPLTTATLSGNPPFALSFQLNTAAAPLAGGTHSFTLQYPGGSQWAPATTAAQTVTVSDFTLAPGTPTVTVSPGASATETLNVTYQGGLAATTTFTCSGLPSEAACTPLSVTGTGPATLTITTTGSTTARLHWLTGGGAAFACLLLFGYPLRRRKWLLLPCTLLVLSLVSLTGCGGGNGGSSGGGSGSGGGGTGGNSGTPAGTYTVTVTATTSGGPSVITHTTTYQLTVN
jgi:hypothetical protein